VIDDKGAVIAIVGTGFPPFFHEQNAVRAEINLIPTKTLHPYYIKKVAASNCF
jgi:hypothetical protein